MATPTRRRGERGAIAVMVALLFASVLIPVAAIGVDLGMQRVARRDMQGVADLTALDLSRLLDGRTKSALTSDMNLARDRAVARNSGTLGSAPTVTYVLGALKPNGDFDPTVDPPTAVQVKAESKVDFLFASAFGIRGGPVARTAVGQAAAGACFLLGSYAARFKSGGSPVLGPLLGALGSNVSLSAADYTGLVGANVNVAGLLGSKVGLLTVEQAVAGNQLISLGSYYLAVANALSKDGSAAAQVTLLQTLALGLQNVSVRAGDLLGLGSTGSSGLDATLNVLDVVTAGAAVANGANGLSLPGVKVNLGPLANVNAAASVVEGPRPGCGRKGDPKVLAETAQGRVALSMSAADVAVPGLLRTNVSLTGSVKAASATGALADVRCVPGPGITVNVVNGLVEVDLTLQVTVSASVLGIPIPVVTGPIRITGSKTSSGQAIINVVNNDYSKATTVGAGTTGLPTLTVNTSGLTLIGLPVGVVLAPITNLLVAGLVNPLIAGLDPVIAGLLNPLGIDLSGADVYARPTPRCDEPNLVG